MESVVNFLQDVVPQVSVRTILEIVLPLTKGAQSDLCFKFDIKSGQPETGI